METRAGLGEAWSRRPCRPPAGGLDASWESPARSAHTRGARGRRMPPWGCPCGPCPAPGRSPSGRLPTIGGPQLALGGVPDAHLRGWGRRPTVLSSKGTFRSRGSPGPQSPPLKPPPPPEAPTPLRVPSCAAPPATCSDTWVPGRHGSELPPKRPGSQGQGRACAPGASRGTACSQSSETQALLRSSFPLRPAFRGPVP